MQRSYFLQHSCSLFWWVYSLGTCFLYQINYLFAYWYYIYQQFWWFIFLSLIICRKADVKYLSCEFEGQMSLPRLPVPRTGCCFVLRNSCSMWKPWKENSELLNFGSSHLITKPSRTLWNGLWKTYRWFWKKHCGRRVWKWSRTLPVEWT